MPKWGKHMTKKRHLITVNGISDDDVAFLLKRAAEFRALNRQPDKKHPSLKGRTLLNVFFENSTRTRTSFELAGKRLGMDVINMSVGSSSISKGETLKDTAETLSAMQADAMVVRHDKAGSAQLFAEFTDSHIINAGDGAHQHPSQALLDGFTLLQHYGTQNLKGKKVVICGDILHSRVARSVIPLFKRLGAEVSVVAPKTLTPIDISNWNVPHSTTMDEGLKDVDVIYLLRLQRERMAGCFIPSLDEYFSLYCLTPRRLKLAKDDAVVMHPGPINRGVEIDTYLADNREICRILEQVEAGVAIRQAILEWVLGS